MARRGRLLSLFLTALAIALGGPVAAQEPLFNTEGYRQAHYRSPTPEQVDGAITLDTAGLQDLLARQPHSVLIDTYRRQWLFGRFIPDEEHRNLPGSVWLANTGDGLLLAPWKDYFETQLQRLSQGRHDWPLVFYCRSDCWLGWNAARRAHALGYTQLYWYRDGIDAWEQAGLPLELAEPEPLTDATALPGR